MKSVRMLATGAVVFVSLAVLTAPVRACDDRYIQKCEDEAAAAFAADQQSALPATPRRKGGPRVRSAVAVVKPAARKIHLPPLPAPIAAATRTESFRLASDGEARAESPLMRRFHGFIDPQPMTNNSFEALRRPRLNAEHLTPAPAMPPSEEVAVAADDEIVVAELPAEAAAPATAPAAVVPAPVTAVAPVPAPAPALAEAAPAPGNEGSGFPLGKLALTLCAALGVASALRFIVRA